MACIFKRGKTWSYSVDIGHDEKGKRKKKGKGGFRTQKEAKEAAAILEAELANGVFIDETKITFGVFSEQWLEEYSKTVRPNTFRRRRSDLDKLKLEFNDFCLKDITKMQCQKIMSSLFEKGYSQSTLKGIYSTANLIFKRACEYEVIKSNPLAFVIIPKNKLTVEELESDIEIPKYLEKNELSLFLKTAKESSNYSDYVMFLTLAYTGMRRGELLALKWSNIDFKNNIISIRKTVDTMVGSVKNYVLGPPKTKRSRRDIIVTRDVIKELLKHKLIQKQEIFKHQTEWHKGDFIFTSERIHGYPKSGSVIKYKMKKLLDKAKLNTALSPHSLRHTHTSLLAEAGVSLEAIMERLGHANDTVTKLIYLHITKDVKKDTAQKFQKLMNSI